MSEAEWQAVLQNTEKDKLRFLDALEEQIDQANEANDLPNDLTDGDESSDGGSSNEWPSDEDKSSSGIELSDGDELSSEDESSSADELSAEDESSDNDTKSLGSEHYVESDTENTDAISMWDLHEHDDLFYSVLNMIDPFFLFQQALLTTRLSNRLETMQIRSYIEPCTAKELELSESATSKR